MNAELLAPVFMTDIISIGKIYFPGEHLFAYCAHGMHLVFQLVKLYVGPGLLPRNLLQTPTEPGTPHGLWVATRILYPKLLAQNPRNLTNYIVVLSIIQPKHITMHP